MSQESTGEEMAGLGGSTPPACAPAAGDMFEDANNGGHGAETDASGMPEQTAGASVDTNAIDPELVAQARQVAEGDAVAFEGLDQARRSEAVLFLVEGLDAVETRKDFLDLIVQWRLEIDRIRSEEGLPRAYTEDGLELISGTTTGPDDAAATPDPGDGTAPPQEAGLAPDGYADMSEAEKVGALYQVLRDGATSLAVGDMSAPGVYAFIDPLCGYSAKAVETLSSAIGAGDIHLKVVFTPVLHEDSKDVISAILLDEAPPVAFFDHEIEFAKFGRYSITPRPFADLPGNVRAGIRQNYEIMRVFGIRGVPAFVFLTENGPEKIVGLPASENTFADAIHMEQNQ